jgi:hypothetical protein
MRKSRKPLEDLSEKELINLYDHISDIVSGLTTDLINAGRGREYYSETKPKNDSLSKQYISFSERLRDIASEKRRRMEYHGNLKPIRRRNNPPAVLIYPHVLEIWASKKGVEHHCDSACKRANHVYRHKFKTQPKIYGLSNGDLLIKKA